MRKIKHWLWAFSDGYTEPFQLLQFVFLHHPQYLACNDVKQVHDFQPVV
jgi:hypothetical protein